MNKREKKKKKSQMKWRWIITDIVLKIKGFFSIKESLRIKQGHALLSSQRDG